MTPVEFWSICSMNGLVLDDGQMDKMVRYVGDLLYWNEKINLISRRDTEQIWKRHILHSLAPVLLDMIPKTGRVLDIGSGGGLPGIPMKIARPGLEMVLLDSISKKVKTVEMLASHVIDHGLTAIRERAEEMPTYPEYAGSFDLVIARAVAPLVDLIGWARPLLRPDTGQMVLLKGGTLIDELDHAVGKHPDAEVTIHEIKLTGIGWFEEEQKRIVTVRLGKEGAPHKGAPRSQTDQGDQPEVTSLPEVAVEVGAGAAAGAAEGSAAGVTGDEGAEVGDTGTGTRDVGAEEAGSDEGRTVAPPADEAGTRAVVDEEVGDDVAGVEVREEEDDDEVGRADRSTESPAD